MSRTGRDLDLRGALALGGGEKVHQLLRLVVQLARAEAQLGGAVQVGGGDQRGRQGLGDRVQAHPHPLGVLCFVLTGPGKQLLCQDTGQVRRGRSLQKYDNESHHDNNHQYDSHHHGPSWP